MIGNAGEHLAQIFGIEAIEFRRTDQAVDGAYVNRKLLCSTLSGVECHYFSRRRRRRALDFGR
jgi:phosphoribosyl-AMP cyclohydrolase